MEKYCTRCNMLKDISAFYKRGKFSHLYKSHCKDCCLDKTKEYNESHPDRHKEEYNRNKKQYKERARKASQTYRIMEEYKIKQKEYNKKRFQRIKGTNDFKIKRRTLELKYKSQKKVGLDVLQVNELINKSGNICFWCDQEIPIGQMQIDHIYPLSKGGTSNINNLVISCSKCNQKKGAKDPEEWLNQILDNSQIVIER